MALSKEYKIIPLEDHQDYAYLIVLCTSRSPFDYIDDISKELNGAKPCTVVIDQILHAGNTDRRFMTFEYNGSEIESGRFAKISKKSSIRKLSCGFLNEAGLTDSPTLTSVQARMIKKGITI